MRLTAEVTEDRTWMRHALFLRCALGEPWTIAATFADACKDAALSVEQMHLIEQDWRDEGWKPAESETD